MRFEACNFYGGVGKLMDQGSALGIIKKLKDKWKINVESGFKSPGFKYFKNLKSEDFKELRRYPHMVGANYGKNPIWVLWLTEIDGQRYSFYINFATKQVIWSKHRFADWLYREGCLFEGEVLERSERSLRSEIRTSERSERSSRSEGNKGKHSKNAEFVIWDILIHRGRYLKRSKFQKMSVVREILDHHYCSDSLVENLLVSMKEFVKIEYLQSFYEKVLSKDRLNRGLVFVPMDRSVKCYSLLFRHGSQLVDGGIEGDELKLVKIEEDGLPRDEEFRSEERTFLVGRVEGQLDNYYIYSLIQGDKGCNQLVRNELVVLTSVKRSHWMRELFLDRGELDLLKFRCKFVKRFMRWEPLELDGDGWNGGSNG